MSIKPTKKTKSDKNPLNLPENKSPSAAEAVASKPIKSTVPRPDKTNAADKTPAIEEAIEIALEAASTAVDSALEIQRIRAESFKLITESRKSSRLLLYSATLIFLLAAVAVFGSLVYFKRAMNDLDLITKVNRDALLVFSGEINGLVAVAKKVDENVKSSSQALDAIALSNSDLAKQVQVLTLALNTANANITKLEAQEKRFAEIKQSLDELSSATRSANARTVDLISAASRPAPSTPQAKTQVMVRPPVATRPNAGRPAASAPSNSMIRYP
jgi:hypothetical protein